MREKGEAIQEMPPFEEPMAVLSIEIYRDGGSTEVIMKDAQSRQLVLFFDYRIGISPRGQLYLAPEMATMRPVAQNSSAERDITRLLHQYLDQNYSAQEQQRLAALDGSKGFYNISQHDHEGYLLLRSLKQMEELRKQAILGIIERI